MTLTAQQTHALDVLRPLLGNHAEAMFRANGCSLHKLTAYARDSFDRSCQPLLTSLALAKALLAEEMTAGAVFDAPSTVTDYLKLHFAGQAYESFVVAYLDAQHRLISIEDLFRGTLTQTSVYPREVAQRALSTHAAAVVLAHNHPSGGIEPSRADEHLTRTLKQALALIDVRVVDHVVVAGSRSTSMAERGLI